MDILLFAVVILCFCETVFSRDLELLPCEPTDKPLRGGYGPVQDIYYPGDVIYYYCETETYLDGDTNRTCEYSGSWSGEAPFCDNTPTIVGAKPTSIQEPKDENHGSLAYDQDRSTCSATLGEVGDTWTAEMHRPGEVKRVAIFARPGRVHYEVSIIIPDGGKFSCGTRQEEFERLTWYVHHCPSPFSRHVVGIEVKSYIAEPLQLCEVVVHGRPIHGCSNPGLIIPNGYLEFNRLSAELKCAAGFERSTEKWLYCLGTNVWTRKKLFCIDKRTSKR